MPRAPLFAPLPDSRLAHKCRIWSVHSHTVFPAVNHTVASATAEAALRCRQDLPPCRRSAEAHHVTVSPSLATDLASFLLPGAAHCPRAASSDGDRITFKHNVQQREDVTGRGPGGGRWGRRLWPSLEPWGYPQGVTSLLSKMKMQVRSVPCDVSGEHDGDHRRAHPRVCCGQGV